MKRISAFSTAAALCLYAVSQGTIINIPTDYSTIQQGINASIDGDTVLVQPGTYVENVNFNGHNIVLGSLFLTTGDTSYIDSTVIDGGSSGSVVTFMSHEGNAAMAAGFTIRNGLAGNGSGIHCSGSGPRIINNYITENQSYGFGGGVYCDSNSTAIFIKNVIVANNGDWGGGGFYIENSEVIVEQNLIMGNTTVTFGGGILCNLNANALIINNTFINNSAYFGGALGYLNYSNPIVNNSIFWGDSSFSGANEIYGDGTSVPAFTYCDVQNALPPGEGNIDIDPLFRDPDNGDFHLMAIDCGDNLDSPCIDVGSPNIADSLLDCSWGLGGLRSDMGAYGGGDSGTVDIIDNDCFLPNKIALLQNYPNPFNNGTTIRFSIVKSTEVRLAVYDVLGRKIQTLIDEYKLAGIYTADFNATGLSSGVYFCRLQAGEAVETRPMVLLK